MSVSFRIQSASGSYAIAVASGIFEQTLRENSHAIFLADEYFLPALAETGVSVLGIEANERSKSLEALPELILRLKALGANRQSTFVALGGGVVQDIATFITSVYMRGVPWVYIPSTVLAMVDSCIGGKSSINVGNLKNILGTFHPPVSISIDPDLVGTLNQEQRVAGLIEAAKICYCRSADVFAHYLSLAPSGMMPVARIEKVIEISLFAKKWFIEIDEYDRKERLLLNFGHTFGHALEGASQFRIAHGIGVGLGIQCAIQLGRLLGSSYPAGGRVSELETHLRDILEDLPTLADEIKSLSMDGILKCFHADKKHGADTFNMIIPAESGDVELVSLSKNEKSIRSIESSFNTGLGKFL
jgi:3-dehydroquinate synthase